jgi:hypothetical protein
MGRITRYGMTEDIVTAIDFGSPTPGKILIYNTSVNDIRVGYARTDVDSTTGVNYFTILAGTQYVFDVGPNIGFLAQNQQLFLNSPDGDATIEVWVANNM